MNTGSNSTMFTKESQRVCPLCFWDEGILKKISGFLFVYLLLLFIIRVEATVENPLPASIPGLFVLVHYYLSLYAHFLLLSSSFAESPSKYL